MGGYNQERVRYGTLSRYLKSWNLNLPIRVAKFPPALALGRCIGSDWGSFRRSRFHPRHNRPYVLVRQSPVISKSMILVDYVPRGHFARENRLPDGARPGPNLRV